MSYKYLAKDDYAMSNRNFLFSAFNTNASTASLTERNSATIAATKAMTAAQEVGAFNNLTKGTITDLF